MAAIRETFQYLGNSAIKHPSSLYFWLYVSHVFCSMINGVVQVQNLLIYFLVLSIENEPNFGQGYLANKENKSSRIYDEKLGRNKATFKT